MASPVEERCTAEIVRLHDAFVEWFTGSSDNTRDAYDSEIGSALSPSFSMVTPSGNVVPAVLLGERLRGAHGSHSERGIEIEIRNAQVASSVGLVHLVRYEEWQRSGGRPPVAETARISTALLREEEGNGPHGLMWMHVHETWMPEKGPS
uniref:Sucrose-phosphatase C-terminal domain-containing protein n=1 Tax=Odontella aurita TaxID=265563 RepID=A0A7S4NIX8_9STRA